MSLESDLRASVRIQELREQKEKLREVLKTVLIGIQRWSINAETTIVTALRETDENNGD